MHQRKSKKIFFYTILFLVVGTLNHKNFTNLSFDNKVKINVSGLDEKNNFLLKKNLNFLNYNNLFFLKKDKIVEIIKSNKLVESYSVSKMYPSTLNVKISQTKFLAQTQLNNETFLLGSNGRLIKIDKIKNELPFIFGKYDNENFFRLKKAIDETEFNYSEIKNLFFFKSGRWDIETKSGILIKLPKYEIKKSLELFIDFYIQNKNKKIKNFDLRQSNQMIIDE
tara:strand:+ start:32 stop:703 length:672 start_codon:yes stop_codon:yes gene_type:complete